MDKILTNSISDSFVDALDKRTHSSIYGTFILYWFIFHWRFIFTIFFVGENQIWNSTGLLKNDYLSETFFNYHLLSFYLWWLLPALFTYLTIWKFPKWISIPAFKKEQRDEAEKEIFKLQLRKDVVKAQTELEKENVKKVGLEKQKIKTEKAISKVDPTTVWEKDYARFEKSTYFVRYLNFLNGFYASNTYIGNFPSDDISYFDAMGLIQIEGNTIKSLTPKGKYFALRLKETPG